MEEIIQNNIYKFQFKNSLQELYITDAYFKIDDENILFLCKNTIFIHDIVLNNITNYWLSDIITLIYLSLNLKKFKNKKILEIGSDIQSLLSLFFEKNEIIIIKNNIINEDDKYDLIILSNYFYILDQEYIINIIKKQNSKFIIVNSNKKLLEKIKDLYDDEIKIIEKKLIISDRYYMNYYMIHNLWK